jgi:LTR polyprotein gag-polypeptide-like protein
MSASQTGNVSAAGLAPAAPTSPPSFPVTTSPPLPKHSRARYDVPMLDHAGKEYAHWKLRLQLVFEARDLWGVIDGSEPKPDITTDPAGHADWRHKDLEAQIQIVMSVQGECLNTILGATSAKECWDKLSARYEGKGEQRLAYLMEELFHHALSESEPMDTQINNLLGVARNLESLGIGMDEKVIAFAIVMALPDSLNTLKTILYSTRGADLSIEDVTAQIYSDEQRRIRASGSDAVTYYAKAAKKEKRGKTDNKDKKKCSHCKRKGHDVSECRKLKQGNEGKGASPSSTQKPLPASATGTPKFCV